MRLFTRTFQLIVVLAGVLGFAICLAVGAGAWWVGARLHQANDKVFERIDLALVASRSRVLAAQTRVRALKITAEDVRQDIEARVREEAKERLASRPEVGGRVEQLALGLQQMDGWLEISASSLESAQAAMETARSLGAAADPAVVGPWLEQLGLLRGHLKQTTETVDTIRDRIARAAEGETLEERITRLGQLAVRVVATFTEIDSRLGKVADGLAAVNNRGDELRSRTHRYILTAQLVGVVFAAWMALGQIFLGRYGWMSGRADD